MAKLIYSAFTSLDGYDADETGNFDWAELDEEVHAFINSRERLGQDGGGGVGWHGAVSIGGRGWLYVASSGNGLNAKLGLRLRQRSQVCQGKLHRFIVSFHFTPI